VLAAPAGAVLAACRFPGRPAVLVILNALLGLPPVVVGLVVYLLLSRSGPLGGLGLLFTPAAMVIAQVILTGPTHEISHSRRRSSEGQDTSCNS
jgi:tungstate transport system permease protein